MKKFCAIAAVTIFAVLSLPLIAAAQESWPPPTCCPRSPGVLTETEAPVLASFSVPEAWLQAQGMTRTDLADRLASVFFPGAGTQYLVTWKRVTVMPNVVASRAEGHLTSGDESLVQFEEKLTYRFLRSQLMLNLLNSTDEFYLTNGVATIKVEVSRTVAVAAGQP